MGKKGRNALLVVMAATALVLTPLMLAGVYLGFYIGEAVGYSKSVLAIAFSTAGFLVGMAVLFRVIRALVARTEKPSG